MGKACERAKWLAPRLPFGNFNSVTEKLTLCKCEFAVVSSSFEDTDLSEGL